MNRQRKMAKNVGKDTHVRSFQGNIFKSQSSNTFQTIAGEISLTQPEPLFRQNIVTVTLARGGQLTSVAYPGAFIDPITGNLHGTYEGPIPGQMVMVGFENGNMNSPYVTNRYPYQGIGNTLVESRYINPLTGPMAKVVYDSTDVMMGHFTGSYLSFNTGILSGKLPGSMTINVLSDIDITSNIGIVTISALSHIALNGNTNFAVKYTELKTAFDQLKADHDSQISIFNAHVHAGVSTGGGSSAVSPTPGSPSTADMAPSKNSKVLM